jgi:hypothetical protein
MLIFVILNHFFQALTTSPIYIEWMPAGKLADTEEGCISENARSEMKKPLFRIDIHK